MLLHFDDATSLTGARLWRRDKLIILYGLHHTLELQCIAGPGNDPVDMESRNCTRWELTITPSLASPSLVLASASYSENIAVGDTLSFDFSTATVEMYRYVAGNATAPGVFQLLGYEGSEDVATVAIQFPVILRTTTVNPCPPDITTALMNEIQRAADSTTSAANATSSAELSVTSMASSVEVMSADTASIGSEVLSASSEVMSTGGMVSSTAEEVFSAASSVASGLSSASELVVSVASLADSAGSAATEAIGAASQAGSDASLASAYASAAESAMHNASNRSEEADEHAIVASAMASAATSAAASAGDAVASRFASAISGVDSYVSLAQEAAVQTASNANVVMSIAENIGSGGSPEWGRITGTLSSQADLSSALDGKVDSSVVGAANGVASLDANSLVPSVNLPSGGNNKLGGVKITGPYGVDIWGGGGIFITKATDAEIDAKTNLYKPIVPSNLDYAVTAALTDANHITLTTAQQQTAQSVIGAGGVLHGSGAPTTSTVGKLLDRYEDDATQKTYTCTAITVDDTDPQNPVTTYTWTDDVNAKGGTFASTAVIHTGPANDGVYIGKNLAIGVGNAQAGTDYWGLMVGAANTLSASGAITFGLSNSAGLPYSIAMGAYLRTGANHQLVAGKYNIIHNSVRITGGGSSDSSRMNIEELSEVGDHYIIGGHQQKVTEIPAATTEYTLAEGAQSHAPSDASTYTLPAVPMRIISDGMYFTRNPATDGTGYYGWLNGSTNRYTTSATPSVGDNTYTNTALTSGAKAITSIDNRTHECILDVLFTGYARSTSDDGTGYYAWKDTTGNLLYTSTDAPTAGTTEAFTDTALSTSAGTIALYDSASSSIAMVGTYSFEDSGGNTITSLSTPTIKPGSVVTFLCRWSALLEQWTIMPVPQGVKLPVAEVTP